MNMFHVSLYCIDERGVRTPLGRGQIFADTEQDAVECAMQTWWDPRLEAAGCTPAVIVAPCEVSGSGAAGVAEVAAGVAVMGGGGRP